jgi:hypothetical protein
MLLCNFRSYRDLPEPRFASKSLVFIKAFLPFWGDAAIAKRQGEPDSPGAGLGYRMLL